MLFETRDFVHRVYGVPLYYNEYSSFHQQPSPEYSPPYDFMMAKLSTQISPLTLTPPISPISPSVEQQSRRSSVIMKVENCQIMPAIDDNSEPTHVCRWESCYRWVLQLSRLITSNNGTKENEFLPLTEFSSHWKNWRIMLVLHTARSEVTICISASGKVVCDQSGDSMRDTKCWFTAGLTRRRSPTSVPILDAVKLSQEPKILKFTSGKSTSSRVAFLS